MLYLMVSIYCMCVFTFTNPWCITAHRFLSNLIPLCMFLFLRQKGSNLANTASHHSPYVQHSRDSAWQEERMKLAKNLWRRRKMLKDTPRVQNCRQGISDPIFDLVSHSGNIKIGDLLQKPKHAFPEDPSRTTFYQLYLFSLSKLYKM